MGIVAAYSFDTAAVVDDSGNGHNGTLFNSPTFPVGHTGLGFNGVAASSQYAQMDDSDVYNFGSSWTVMAWVKPTTFPAAGCEIICKQNQWWFSFQDVGGGTNGFFHGFYKSIGGTASIGTLT